jgi:hypothetical protein
MGRKKKVLTPEELDARKKRWWGPERNARRRERYHQDTLFREKTIQTVRDKYRKTRAEEGLPVRQDDCRSNLDRLRMIGQVRELRVDAQRTVRALTFTVDEFGEALTRNAQVLYRWISADMLPGPVFEARNHRNRWQSVYTVQEVRAMIEVFGSHQEQSQYYRSFHTETRDKLFAASEVARAESRRGDAA